jgi:hypothetical protein
VTTSCVTLVNFSKIEFGLEFIRGCDEMEMGYVYNKTTNETQITEEASKARGLLNKLLWGKYILLNKKEQVFYTFVERISRYICKIWMMDYRVKKKLFIREKYF